MGDKFWMVYGEGQNLPRFRHDTYSSAETEAERLARMNPGIAFYVLMPVAVSKRVDVETRKLVDLDDQIPF
jgi:hypothetical protein